MTSNEAVPPPPWRRQRPKARVREPLTQERIVDAAMKIVDSDGMDALSMRRIGDDLNTAASALYMHVADKDELLELMFDRVMAEVPIPEPDPDNWQELLKQYYRDLLAAMLSHRDLAKATLGRAPFGPNGLQAVEKLLTLGRAGGLPDHITAYAGDLLGSYVGVTAIECNMYPQPAIDGHEPDLHAFTTQVREYLKSLPPERFPNVVALAGPLTDAGSTLRFELGLDIIVRGLASYAVSE